MLIPIYSDSYFKLLTELLFQSLCCTRKTYFLITKFRICALSIDIFTVYYFSYYWIQNTFSDTPTTGWARKKSKKLMGTERGVFVLFFFFPPNVRINTTFHKTFCFWKAISAFAWSSGCILPPWEVPNTPASLHTLPNVNTFLKLLQSHYLTELRKDFLPDPSAPWVKILLLSKNPKRSDNIVASLHPVH